MTKTAFAVTTVFLLAFSAESSLSATELYQWVDENGTLHFSQQPPAHLPGLQAVDVHGTPVVSGDSQKVSITGVVEAVPTAPAPLPEPEQVDNPEKDADKCAQAQRTVADLQQFERVKTEDATTGEERYLGEEEIAIQLKNWRDRTEIYC